MEFNESMIFKIGKTNRWGYSKEFIEFLKYKLSSPISVINLAKEIGMGYAALKRIIDENNIEVLITPNNIKFTAIYQNYDWCYEMFMNKGMNHAEMAKEANCSIRVIEKWCREVHGLTQKYRQKHKQLNEIQHNLLIGSMLGDGHIDKRETQPMFIVCHAENQKDYLYWKYNILKDLCNIPPVEKQETERYFSNNNKVSLCQKQYRFCTRIYDCLKKYRSMNYKDLLKDINDFSLAIWILDDGYRGDSNWQLCVAEYTQTEIEFAIKLFKERFNCISRQEKDKRYIRFDAESSRKLDKTILKSIPNDLDIVKDKIINNSRIHNKQKYIMLKINNKDIKLTDYCRENDLDYRRIINRTYKGINIYDSIQKEMSL